MKAKQKMTADAVVVGSGPGGATVARDLTLQGKKVIIVERGKYLKPRGRMQTFINAMGGPFGSFGKGLMVTTDFLMMIRAVCVGGTTMFFTATAWDPPYEKFKKFGVDLPESETEKIKEELRIAPLSQNFVGPAAEAIMTSARDLGYDWKKFNKFINPAKGNKINCMDTYCGDRHEVKWEAIQWVRDAVDKGATLLPRMHCDEVIIENDTATGIHATDHKGREYEIQAPVVVISAGGVGSPAILQRTGIPEAGRKFFFDPFMVTYGYIDQKTQPGRELPMVAGMDLHDEGIMITDITNPWFQNLLFNMLAQRPHKMMKNRGQVSIMTKVKDVMDGTIDIDGKICKPLTYEDRNKLNKGKIIARRILRNLGARDIWNGALGAAHPGGTCRIGEVVNENLETKYRNLFVSDASVIPSQFGVPPVLTLICLSRRLSGHLLSSVL